MEGGGEIRFGPFRFDLANTCVWRGPQRLRLTPKAFDLLRALLSHAGRLVTKDALLQAVWSEATVSEAALTVCMTELRRALGDMARAPQYIETIHRRGYRFCAPVDASAARVANVPGLQPRVSVPGARVDVPGQVRSSNLPVGREAELDFLQETFTKVRRGERQTVFVTGEPGIGKTTLVDAFLARLATETSPWVARGQCLEHHHGPGEAYLPILDALGRLGRAPQGERLRALLEQYAPTWLVHLPALLRDDEPEELQHRMREVTRGHMLRELTEALEALSVERPLVLVLEDLHWSDMATLDLVSWLAQRRGAARLLVLGTYRPVEVIVHEHPLKMVKQELEVHRQCVEVPLALLSEAAVAQYLSARFGWPQVATALAPVLHRRTSGNPLFLVAVVDRLVQQGLVLEEMGRSGVPAEIERAISEVPESLRQMIEQQLTGLSTEAQQMLEAASVAGQVFATAAVAAGVEAEDEVIEKLCADLAQRGQFLRASGLETWPDGTVTERYQFLHVLYQQTVYDRLAAGRCLRLHRRIGERLEAGYGAQASEQAVMLAEHFESGREAARAASYRQQAADTALRRHAYREAIEHLTKGLALLKTLPDTPSRRQQELSIQMALGPALVATKGYASPDVAQVYERARVLCQQLGKSPQLFWVLRGLCMFSLVRAELQTAQELAAQLVSLAEQAQKTDLLIEAHYLMGNVMFWSGEFSRAQQHLTYALARNNLQQHHAPALVSGENPAVGCHAFAAWCLWNQGYPDHALQRCREAISLAYTLSHPFSLARSLHYAAIIHRNRREPSAAAEKIDQVLALSRESGFVHRMANSTILQGWVQVVQGQQAEGIAQMRQGLEAYHAHGARLGTPSLLALLAEAYGQAGQIAEGLRLLERALTTVADSGERYCEAELYRLRGDLLVQQGQRTKAKDNWHGEAEACFRQALDIARRQQAKCMELRAAVSLSRLWQGQGKRAEAHRLLAEIYGWFSEGFDTVDLKEANALLVELACKTAL